MCPLQTYPQVPGRSPSEAVRYVGRVHGLDFETSGSIVQQRLDDQPEFAQEV